MKHELFFVSDQIFWEPNLLYMIRSLLTTATRFRPSVEAEDSTPKRSLQRSQPVATALHKLHTS